MGSSSNGLSSDDNEITCPACSRTLNDLTQLNYHLDIDHGFENTETRKVSNPDCHAITKEGTKSTSQIKYIPKGAEVSTAHWRKPIPGKSVCFQCKRILGKDTGLINCRKCGELYCRRHCRNAMRLNSHAQYDPLEGKWVSCCYRCFSERDGYNDYGYVSMLTNEFQRLRRTKNEDRQLRKVQLENRLVRLVNGMMMILKNNSGSILASYKVSREISSFERAITVWKDDKSVLDCSVCSQPFGLTLRKHHCRTCGNIVCDSSISNCSNEVPLTNLINAANDLPFRESNPQNVDEKYSIRICSNCIHTLYVERKFKKDIEKTPSLLLSRCESAFDLSEVISYIWPSLNHCLEEIENAKKCNTNPTAELIKNSSKLRKKLTRAVESYNVLTRQISKMSPRNNSEQRIQQSFQMASSLFIKEKLFKLKSAPLLNQESNSTWNNATPETNKLSYIVFNNLTIKEVKNFREELMVLKEQKFLVESMIEGAKKQRKFDELSTLNENISEIEKKIEDIQRSLGDQGFN